MEEEITEQQKETIKSFILTQHMITDLNCKKQRRRKSLEKCDKADYYCSFKYKAAQKRLEKQKEFDQRDFEYLKTLLKKLKKIFKEAKEESDLKQLNYLKKKLYKTCGDKTLINNKIRKDFFKLDFEIKEELRKLGA